MSHVKVVAFNGSPRKDGNTAILIRRVFSKLEDEGIECEMVQLAGHLIRGCTACGVCRQRRDRRCSIGTDVVNYCIDKMLGADGIIIGSPVYFAGLTAETTALIDRTGYVARANSNMFRRKVGAAVTAVRRAGAMNVLNSLNAWFLINELVIPGSTYWNLAVGRQVGDVENDHEGLETMDRLGENMAWLLKRLNG